MELNQYFRLDTDTSSFESKLVILSVIAPELQNCRPVRIWTGDPYIISVVL